MEIRSKTHDHGVHSLALCWDLGPRVSNKWLSPVKRVGFTEVGVDFGFGSRVVLLGRFGGLEGRSESA